MFMFPILVLVTLLVIAGYFIQFAAQFAEGFMRPFGKYLALWVFVLAGLLIVAAALGPALGYRGAGPGFGGPRVMRGIGRGGFGGGFAGRRVDGRFFERRLNRRQAGQPPAGAPATQTPTPEGAPSTPAPAP
jgi:hypothetical protein